MSDIPTWRERALAHPDHQSGMVSTGMIQARMEEEIDDLRAEVERLRAERDALRSAAKEYLETLGGAMKSGKFEMAGTAEMAHFVRQAMQKLDSLAFDRDGPRPAGLERLHEPHGKAS